jgi:hypothetical protein
LALANLAGGFALIAWSSANMYEKTLSNFGCFGPSSSEF